MVGALEEGLGFLDNVRQWNRIGQGLEDGQIQLAREQLPCVLAVSYTHLTLPTKA